MSYLDLFQRLEEKNIDYVVPRKYDRLPETTLEEGGDVDLIFRPSEFEDGLEACREVGFENKHNAINHSKNLVGKALSNPKRAITVALFDQSNIIKEVKSSGRGNDLHKNKKLVRSEQELDLRNNLAYKSPSNRRRYPVDDSVTHGMLARRQKENEIYVPHPSDELAHILPHCIFDKRSSFSDYYVERCNELFGIVEADEDYFKLFRGLLNTVFYSAGDYVLELTRGQRYDNMLEELRQFHDY